MRTLAVILMLTLTATRSSNVYPCSYASEDCGAKRVRRDRECVVRVGTRACGAEFNTCTGVARMWCY